MLKRVAVLTVAGAGFLGLAAGPAGATQYPPHANIVTVSSPCPGADATLGGSVADQDGKPLAGATVNLTVDGASVGSPVSGADGKYTFNFTAPTQEGDHPVTATATIDGATGPTVNASLKVVSCAAAPTPSRPDLPRTGSSDSTMNMVKVGVALTALGGALVAVAKRRRRGTAIA